MSYDGDNYDEGTDEFMYALTWHNREGHPLYWSAYHGWVTDPAKAWTLTLEEVERVTQDDALEGKLPKKRDALDGAEWEPIYRRLPLYAPGVSDDDDLLSGMINRTGEQYG